MIRKKLPQQPKPKVVGINDAAPTTPGAVIASDDETRRYVFAIGRHRIAYDVTTRITRVSPEIGNRPAPVLSIDGPKRNPPRDDQT